MHENGLTKFVVSHLYWKSEIHLALTSVVVDLILSVH